MCEACGNGARTGERTPHSSGGWTPTPGVCRGPPLRAEESLLQAPCWLVAILMVTGPSPNLPVVGHQSHWGRVHPNDLIPTRFSLRDPVSENGHIWRHLGLELQHMNVVGGHNSTPANHKVCTHAHAHTHYIPTRDTGADCSSALRAERPPSADPTRGLRLHSLHGTLGQQGFHGSQDRTTRLRREHTFPAATNLPV